MIITDVNKNDWEQQANNYYTNTGNNWEFSQMFGEEDDASSSEISSESSEENCISSLTFDQSGRFLAVGYNCGQVVVLTQQNDQTYQLYTEFKSHDSAFDFLTSMEIEEKINMIKWYPFSNDKAQRLMTTNDKTVKLFKMWEHSSDDERTDVIVRPWKTYEGGHVYNINSVSFNSDGQLFISTDDLRINLWDVNTSTETFGIVDIKPDNMDDLVEVITCSDFHPQHCNVLIYATSKGIVRMSDMRASAKCDNHTKEFEDADSELGGFFHELVSTISDTHFSPCGRFLVSRDYLTMKVWDTRMEKEPWKVVKFHDHLIPRLCDLYENDCIFDKFECSWSGNSMRVLTGSYNNNFYIADIFGDFSGGESTSINSFTAARPGVVNQYDFSSQLDCSQKVVHTAWHPEEDIIALGANDFGYLYIRNTENDTEEMEIV
eukprot:TRINITY_DN11343_c0_g1_i1.p1 TRINITY_DN11343_c0_g1~~TRINITY_DN11343_c0_g1_i1.p1  ORF type:complete len:433 (-),score=89.81 TRINITY_DN11343_c0_g1_i1:88-1386(-)